jgi:hypothetical protein
MRSWSRLGASATLRRPGRLGGTRDLHSGGPIVAVNQRAERTSPVSSSPWVVVVLAAINAVIGNAVAGDWPCCGRRAPSA